MNPIEEVKAMAKIGLPTYIVTQPNGEGLFNNGKAVVYKDEYGKLHIHTATGFVDLSDGDVEQFPTIREIIESAGPSFPWWDDFERALITALSKKGGEYVDDFNTVMDIVDDGLFTNKEALVIDPEGDKLFTFICKRCKGKTFNVGTSQVLTTVKCTTCKWETVVHCG